MRPAPIWCSVPLMPSRTISEAHQLVEYVYNRPQGELLQECGAVMVTLAALANATGLNLQEVSEAELARVWTKIEQLRAKRATKLAHSPLPGTIPIP